jgi:hypothetical protein
MEGYTLGRYGRWVVGAIGPCLIFWALFSPKPAPEPTRIDLSFFKGEIIGPGECPDFRERGYAKLVYGPYDTFIAMEHQFNDEIYITQGPGDLVKLTIVTPRVISKEAIYFIGEKYIDVGGNYHSLKSIKVVDRVIHLEYTDNHFWPFLTVIFGVALILVAIFA